MKNYWNYRVGTQVPKVPKGITRRRIFQIIECHYKDGIPSSYAEGNPLGSWEEYNDLVETYKLVQAAFSKPILNLDNWPNEYKREDV